MPATAPDPAAELRELAECTRNLAVHLGVIPEPTTEQHLTRIEALTDVEQRLDVLAVRLDAEGRA